MTQAAHHRWQWLVSHLIDGHDKQYSRKGVNLETIPVVLIGEVYAEKIWLTNFNHDTSD